MTSVKEQVTGVYAAALAAQGFAALALDHRHFGESEGLPRQMEVHSRKVEDLLAAVDFLAAHPMVDAEQLAGVGICLGAGYVAAAVAADSRLRAFAGIAGYYRDPSAMRAADAAGFDAKVEQGRQARLHFESTGEVLMIPAAAPAGDAAMQTADTVDYYTRRAAVPNYVNGFALMSREHFLGFDVQVLAPRICVPTLMVHAPQAIAPQWAQQFHAALAAPKVVTQMEAKGQTDFYDNPGLIQSAVRAVAEHLKAALG